MSLYMPQVLVDTQISALSALADQRAAINPSFAKLIIKAYAQGKLNKGKSRAEVGYKLDMLEQELVAMRFPNFGAPLIAVRRELGLPPSRIYISAATSAAHMSAPLAGTTYASSSSTGSRREGTGTGGAGSSGASSTTAPRRTPRAPVQRTAQDNGAATPPPAYERTDPNPDADLIQAIMASLQMANQAPEPEEQDNAGSDGVAHDVTTQPRPPSFASSSQTPSSSTAGAVPATQYAPPPLSELPADRRAPSPLAVPSSSVGPEDPVRLLKGYRTVILVDDSTSMTTAGRWPSTRRMLGALVDLAGQVEAEAEIRFLNSEVAALGLVSRSAVDELFQERGTPGGVTPLGARIEQVLLDYVGRLEQEREIVAALDPAEEVERLQPLNLIVVTDGEILKLTRPPTRPQHNPFIDPVDSAPSDDPESVIVAAARRLDKGHWPLGQLGLFFFQVGDDAEAREYLQALDENLQRTYEIRDMVDTVSYAPDEEASSNEPDGALLRKILLGGVNRRIDRRPA